MPCFTIKSAQEPDENENEIKKERKKKSKSSTFSLVSSLLNVSLILHSHTHASTKFMHVRNERFKIKWKMSGKPILHIGMLATK